jgi:hypothetical protein
MSTPHEILRELSQSPALLDVGRLAVEDALVDLRDARISLVGRGNGLVIREKDCTNSSLIRMGMEDALRIALAAIADHQALEAVNNCLYTTDTKQE